MVGPCRINIYAQKHPMFFLAPGHEKIRTKIPGQQEYNEFFLEGNKLKIHYHRSTVQAKKKIFVTFYHYLLNEI